MGFSLLQKLGASFLIVAWVVWGSNVIADWLVPIPEAPKDAAVAASSPAKPGGPEVAAAAPAAPMPPQEFGKLLQEAAAADGETVFKKCRACHTVDKGGPNRVGPNLWGVVDRPKASESGFSYSSALSGLGGKWTYEDLSHFLTSPRQFAPGTKMGFAGLDKPADRAAVIKFLREHADSPVPLP